MIERTSSPELAIDERTSETIRAWCAARLSDSKVPETLTVQAEPLPRNANGKVMKRILRQTLGAGGAA